MIGKGNKFLALLLCAVMTLSLVTVHVHAEEEHDHDHDLEVSVLAASEAVESSQVCPVHGDHHVYDVRTETDIQPECPKAGKIYELKCQCGESIGYTSGDHHWSNWTVTKAATCTESGTQTRTCTLCQETQTVTLPMSAHSYVTVTVAATATTCPATYQRCVNCGHTEGNTEPEAHTWVKTANDCTMTAYCSKCGAKDTVDKVQVMHKFGGEYYKTAEGHYQKCQNAGCEVTSAVTAHTVKSVSGDCTKGTTCSVCGYEGLTGLEHNYSTNWVISTNASGHVVRCANAGCSVTKTVAHTPGTAEKCTDAVKCTVCGYTITPGGSHTFGPITEGDNLGCIRTCTKCGETEHVSHTGVNDDGDCTTAVVCKTCGYTLVDAYAGHDYSSTVWINDGAGGHYTLCSHPGCLSRHTDVHSGGTATCASAAVCSVCGAGYGSKNANNHTGGTEIRNAKAAAVGAEGYTGDTYCLGCGAVLEKGSAIPALTAGHTHSYSSAWVSDSTGHWHECECGAKKDAAAHSFKDGKCTVCGEADPDYREAEVHIHTYSGVWSGDSQHHWHECTVCGEKADLDVHRFLNGACLECGMTFEQHKEEEKKEQETPAPDETVITFRDVSAEAWYAEPIAFVARAGIMYGVDNGVFDPEGVSTRGTLMVMLARLAGADTENCSPWYAKGVQWAMGTGISDGTRPEDNISRQEIAALLYRYAGYPETGADLSGFTDSGRIESWAREAMEWAVAVGILQGYENGTLRPTATATRAEIATMLYRFINRPAV